MSGTPTHNDGTITLYKSHHTTYNRDKSNKMALNSSSRDDIHDDTDDVDNIDPSTLNFGNIIQNLKAFENDSIVKEALNENVDLRNYSKQIEQQLYAAEILCLKEYIHNVDSFGEIYFQLTSCDRTLSRMNTILGTFQSRLSTISNEIRNLQSLSVGLGVELTHATIVFKRLSSFAQYAYVPPDLVNIINTASNTDDIRPLSNLTFSSSSNINNNSTASNIVLSPQFMQALPRLTHLYLFHQLPSVQNTIAAQDAFSVFSTLFLRSVTIASNVLLSNISSMKGNNTNISIKQQLLLRYKACYEFLIFHCGSQHVDNITRLQYNDDDTTNNKINSNKDNYDNNNDDDDDDEYDIYKNTTTTPSITSTRQRQGSTSTTISSPMLNNTKDQYPQPPTPNGPNHNNTYLTRTLTPSNTITNNNSSNTSPYTHNNNNNNQFPQFENILQGYGDLSDEIRRHYSNTLGHTYIQQFKTYMQHVLKLSETNNPMSSKDLIGGYHRYNSKGTSSRWLSKLSMGMAGSASSSSQVLDDSAPLTKLSLFQSEQDIVDKLWSIPHPSLPILSYKRGNSSSSSSSSSTTFSLTSQYTQLPLTTLSTISPIYHTISHVSLNNSYLLLSTLASIRLFSIGQRDLVLRLPQDTVLLPVSHSSIVTASANQSISNNAMNGMTAGLSTLGKTLTGGYFSSSTTATSPSGTVGHGNVITSISSHNLSAITTPTSSSNSSQHQRYYPFERIFRSALHLLADTAVSEYLFIHNFFGVTTSSSSSNGSSISSTDYTDTTTTLSSSLSHNGSNTTSPSSSSRHTNNSESANLAALFPSIDSNSLYVKHILEETLNNDDDDDDDDTNMMTLLYSAAANQQTKDHDNDNTAITPTSSSSSLLDDSDNDNDDDNNTSTNTNKIPGIDLSMPLSPNTVLSKHNTLINSSLNEPNYDVIKSMLVKCSNRYRTLFYALLPLKSQHSHILFSRIFQPIYTLYISTLEEYTISSHDPISILILIDLLYIYKNFLASQEALTPVVPLFQQAYKIASSRLQTILYTQIASLRDVSIYISSQLEQYSDISSITSLTNHPFFNTINIQNILSQLLIITYKYSELVTGLIKLSLFPTLITTTSVPYDPNISITSSKSLLTPNDKLNLTLLPQLSHEITLFIKQLQREYYIIVDSVIDVMIKYTNIQYNIDQSNIPIDKKALRYYAYSLTQHTMPTLSSSSQQQQQIVNNNNTTIMSTKMPPNPHSKVISSLLNINITYLISSIYISRHISPLSSEYISINSKFNQHKDSLILSLLQYYIGPVITFTNIVEPLMHKYQNPSSSSTTANNSSDGTLSRQYIENHQNNTFTQLYLYLSTLLRNDNSSPIIPNTIDKKISSSLSTILSTLDQSFDLYYITLPYLVDKGNWLEICLQMGQDIHTMFHIIPNNTTLMSFASAAAASIALEQQQQQQVHNGSTSNTSSTTSSTTSPTTATTTSNAATSSKNTSSPYDQIVGNNNTTMNTTAASADVIDYNTDVGIIILNQLHRQFLLYTYRFLESYKWVHDVVRVHSDRLFTQQKNNNTNSSNSPNNNSTSPNNNNIISMGILTTLRQKIMSLNPRIMSFQNIMMELRNASTSQL